MHGNNGLDVSYFLQEVNVHFLYSNTQLCSRFLLFSNHKCDFKVALILICLNNFKPQNQV